MRKLSTERYILSIFFISIAIHHFLPPSVSAFSSQPLTFGSKITSTKLNAIANKNREEELAKLATNLKVSPAKVTELLIGQRRKLSGSEPKAIHIDWLLNVNSEQQESSVPITKKKAAVPKKKTTAVTKKKVPTNKDASLLSNIEFAQRTDLHPATKRALVETLGLVSMTEIQSKTFDAALSGKDVLGRARTG